MIPMAASLGFGVIFATVISLFLVPCGYLILEDIWARLRPGSGESRLTPVPTLPLSQVGR